MRWEVVIEVTCIASYLRSVYDRGELMSLPDTLIHPSKHVYGYDHRQ